MSQLMQMRQRIKAVQTIKKITHAMRLISMSSHSRMKHQEKNLMLYQNALKHLMQAADSSLTTTAHEETSSEKSSRNKQLVILIGSQKGLCGNFNNGLFQFFNLKMASQHTYDVITVGKRATGFIQKHKFGKLISYYDTFSMHNLLSLSRSILNEIMRAKQPYSSVTVYSNYAASFFMQRPIAQQVIPTQPVATDAEHQPEISYTLEQDPQEIITYLAENALLFQIQQALFQSLLAEHAARFVSMDGSTRNAEKLLEQMQRDLNKLRQAKITRELAELSSVFL